VSSVAFSALMQMALLVAVSVNTASNGTQSIGPSTNGDVTNNVAASSPAGGNSAVGNSANSVVNHSAAGTYAAAYQDTQDSGKPLVVLVGATWCPACQGMKTSTMPEVAAKGELRHVAFAYVNTDAQSDLAGKLMEGNLIPQLVMYQKAGDGWTLKRLVGAQSVEAVEEFLGPAAKQDVAVKDNGPKDTAATKESTVKTPTATNPATKAPASTQQSSAGNRSTPTG